MATLHDFTATTFEGHEQDLAEYAGKVVLVVNLPVGHGSARQYQGIEWLWQEYRGHGLVVLGFLCDQLDAPASGPGTQDRGPAGPPAAVTFPVFPKVDVNGPGAHPLWAWLRQERPGVGKDAIKHDFTKFLVGRDGRVIRRYASTTSPSQLAGAIESALAHEERNPAPAAR